MAFMPRVNWRRFYQLLNQGKNPLAQPSHAKVYPPLTVRKKVVRRKHAAKRAVPTLHPADKP